jgi:hypothetical protein
VPAS